MVRSWRLYMRPVAIAPPTDKPERQRAQMVWAFVAVVAFCFAAVLLRGVNLGPSWDIHVDEITYLRISQSVAESIQVKLYGETFYIHPPAYFFLQAGFLKLIEPSGETIQVIYAIRHLNVALAGLSAAAIFFLGWSLSGWTAGIAGALIFALDPFAIRMNSRAMLDTFAIWWVLLGYSILLPSLTNERVMPPMRKLLASGLAFGLAILTKELMAFSTLMPLGMVFLFKWALPRRAIVWLCFFTILTYLPYPLAVALSGDWMRFQQYKLEGVSRLIGLMRIPYQPTVGLNVGALPILEALHANVGQYGTEYVLILCGAAALLYLSARGGASNRMLATWTGSAYVFLAIGVAAGTVEEQFFYFLTIPAILSTVVAWGHLFSPREVRPESRNTLFGASLVAGAALILWSMFGWAQVHIVPDNGHERLSEFMESNIPQGSRIAASTDTGEFLMDGFESGLWGSSLEELRAHNAQYIQVSTKQIEAGYGIARPPLYTWLTEHGELVFAFSGRTYGTLALYRLPIAY